VVESREFLAESRAWYEAALDPGRWPEVVAALAGAFAAEKAQLLGFDRDDGESWVDVAHGIGPGFTSTYRPLIARDPRLHALRRPDGGAALGGAAQLRGCAALQQLLMQPEHDLAHHLMVGAALPRDQMLTFALYRGRDAAPFTPADRDDLERLLPHLRNAGIYMQRMASAHVITGSVEEAIDKLSVALFVIDAGSRCSLLNRAARELIRNGGLALHQRRLCAHDAAESRRLHEAVAALLARRDGSRDMGLALARPGRLPLRLRLTAMPPSEKHDIAIATGDEPLAFVYAIDPEADYETTPQVLARIYGLTTAESELLDGLLGGLRLAVIASSRGTAPSTARAQIKAIFRKTGAPSQSALIRIVSDNPIVRAHRAAFPPADAA